jgi:CheY-like chemotaxis protein
MKTRNKPLLIAPAWLLPIPGSSSVRFTLNEPNLGRVSAPALSEGVVPESDRAAAFAPKRVEPPSIYAVDDEPRLTELYTIVLETAGYRVKPFTDRFDALIAIEQEKRKPDLLIVDYFGSSMLAERFMHRCRSVHRNLRILMASGMSPTDVHFFAVRPDRFIQKPFTTQEFLLAVRAALVAEPRHLSSDREFSGGI